MEKMPPQSDIKISENKQKNGKTFLIAVLVVLLLITTGIAAYSTYQNRQLKKQVVELQADLNTPQETASPTVKPTKTAASPAATLAPNNQTQDEPRDPNQPYGQIEKIYKQNDEWYLDIDYIKFYFGEDDKQEAVEDGLCDSVDSCSWPNNLAKRDVDDIPTTHKISPNVEIDLSGLEPHRQGWSEEQQEYVPRFEIYPNITELNQYFESNPNFQYYNFKFTLSDDVVTSIEGFYIP